MLTNFITKHLIRRALQSNVRSTVTVTVLMTCLLLQVIFSQLFLNFTTTEPGEARVYLLTQGAAVQPRLTCLHTYDLGDKHQDQDYHRHLHHQEGELKSTITLWNKYSIIILIHKDNNSCLKTCHKIFVIVNDSSSAFTLIIKCCWENGC